MATRTRSKKAAEVKQKIAQGALLGEIVTWNARSENDHTHSKVVDALQASGLDDSYARELLPRNAFQRACRKMEKDRLIEAVNETNDVIVFQVTRKLLQQEEFKYEKETFLRLHKETGKLECKDEQLLSVMRQRMDDAMTKRTTNDITQIVQKLFDKNADLFPIREQGGAYFVPREHVGFTERIEAFLNALGGNVGRWPIAAGTKQGDRAVQNSVQDALSTLIAEHNEAVESLTLHTRPDTIEAVAERIKTTRVKIEAYASYLQDRSKGLLKEVEAANAKLAKQVSALSKQRAEMPPVDKKANLVFGHPVTAVIRWMGKEGWTLDEAKRALRHFQLEPADATIQAALGHGRRGQRGEPANLSSKQAKTLTDAEARTRE